MIKLISGNATWVRIASSVQARWKDELIAIQVRIDSNVQAWRKTY